MSSTIRQHLTYANVMATLAFFIAVGGTTVAATKIDGRSIEKGTVSGKALKNSTIRGKKLRSDTLTGAKINEGSLAKVPRAATADSATSATTATNATNAANAGNATTVGGKSAGQLTDSCPAATTAYAGVCIETERRTGATWPVAAKTCGDAGGRLPGLEELEGFRQQPGITLFGSLGEHTSSLYDQSPTSSGGTWTVTLPDSGSPWGGSEYGSSAASYRCAFPLTDSR